MRVLINIIAIIAIAALFPSCQGWGGTHLPPGKPGTSTPPSNSLSAKSHNLTPIASNQWFSNLYAQFPTEPLYTLPAAFRLSPQGVGVSFPDISKSTNSIFAPYSMDVQIGFSHSLQKPVFENIDDWSIGLSMKTGQNEQLRFTLAHGIPFTVFHSTGSSLLLTCGTSCAVYSNNTILLSANAQATVQALSLEVNEHTYILVFDAPHPIQLTENTLSISGTSRVFLGLLDTRDHYDLFKQAASAEILHTTTKAVVNGDQLMTTYTLATSGALPLITLYPHQSSFLSKPLPILGTYETLRGTLSLVQTNAFTTTLPIQTPASSFPALQTVPDDLRSAFIKDCDTFLQQPPSASKDYFLGVWFGRGINLLQLAQTLGMKDRQQSLLKLLEKKFVESMRYFGYNPARTSIIAQVPEFGNDELNDHHFHYGYFIRAAAVLGQFDPAFVSKVKTSVNQMVLDIANSDRGSAQFPYLRTFDIYEGHSWASGFAKFTDGNNQESTSEAIQAWYALYLWSQVTHNSTLQTTAMYLYTTEIQSTKEYWFGLNGIYNGEYQHAIASLVWGGKVDFATWFSPDVNKIYGIQLLPITPGSAYLGQLPEIEPYLDDIQAHAKKGDTNWGDLLLMWQSYYQPEQTLAQKDSIPEANMDSPRSLFLYILYAHAQGISV
jgi:endoglucanase Acf2